MKVTLKDIAQRSGVSVNTVSLALRNMPSVKQETRETILQIAEELNYFATKNKNDRKGTNIALVSTGERLRDSYFYMSFYQYILNTAHDNGYNLMVFQGANCDIDADQLRRKFENSSIAGIIILGDMEERIAAKVAQCGIPVIGIGTRYDDLRVCTVIEDNLMGGDLAVSHLYEKGYRKIGFLGNPLHSTGFMERYQGYVGAMMKYKLPINEEHLVTTMDEVNVYDYNRLFELLKQCPSMPEAFICTNDNMAMFASKALFAQGISVPNDVALVSFDNTALGKMAIPSMTSIDVRCAAQAEACVKKLIYFVENDEFSDERIILPVSLAEGESVLDLTKK